MDRGLVDWDDVLDLVDCRLMLPILLLPRYCFSLPTDGGDRSFSEELSSSS